MGDIEELARIDQTMDELGKRRVTDQDRRGSLETQAHGAELARVKLGAEMQRRTAALPADYSRC